MKSATTALTACTLFVSGSCAMATDKAFPASSPNPSQSTQTEIIPNDTQDVIFNNALKDGTEQYFTIPINYGWVKVGFTIQQSRS